jgi:hypothetical protein
MPNLRVHKDFRAVRNLPFCYLCGRHFVANDESDQDHVPPKCTFNPRDRQTPLTLKTHKSCNENYSVADEKIGQLIAFRRGECRTSKKLRLNLVHGPYLGMTALDNLDVDSAVWRWVLAFHAALYRQPLVVKGYSIRTPFPRFDEIDGKMVLRQLLPQHVAFVENIKQNRVFKNLDSIVSNNGNLTYECVWCKSDSGTRWFCMFAIDIYDWKKLGGRTARIPARGCAGCYELPDGSTPENATRDQAQTLVIPNYDVLDAFAP